MPLATSSCAVCHGSIYLNPITSEPTWTHADMADFINNKHDAHPAG